MNADAEFQSVEQFLIECSLNLLGKIEDYRNDLEKCKLLLKTSLKKNS